ncbi:beta-lactamase/transpeptidase-like protein, partial [Mycena filopes]
PGVPLKFEPGTDFLYAFSSDCLSFIIERLSGKSLEQYLCPRPHLPPTSASFYLTPELKARLLPLSWRNKNGVLERWKGPTPVEQDPKCLKVLFAALNLYASQMDYLTFLLGSSLPASCSKPVLSNHKEQPERRLPPLSCASLETLFSPTHTPAGVASLEKFMAWHDPYLHLPAGAAQLGWGLFVNTVDIPGRRRGGSGTWAGWENTSYFVDPATGVAGVLATQLAPPNNDNHQRLYDLLERALYAGL